MRLTLCHDSKVGGHVSAALQAVTQKLLHHKADHGSFPETLELEADPVVFAHVKENLLEEAKDSVTLVHVNATE